MGSGWSAYIAACLADLQWSNTHFADAIGVHHSLIGRWMSGTAQPTVESVRRVCLLREHDIRDGLIIAGLLTARELRVWTGGLERPELEMFDDDELLWEVRRRLNGKGGLELVDSATTFEHNGSGPADSHDTTADEPGAGENQPPVGGVTREDQPRLPAAG